MKLSTKIILPIILISALLILLTGCKTGTGTVLPDESPAYTAGTITGIIAAPCCSTSAELVSENSGSPEFWCFYCQKEWKLQDGVEVVLTYGEDKVATTKTNNKGEFTFSNVDPGKNYVVTAYCPDYDDDRPLVKDVALEITEGDSFDTKITDLVSTSLGLVVDFLVEYTELGPEDIILEGVIANKPNFSKFPKFKRLVHELSRVLEENCGDVNIDPYLQDALCKASEEVGRETIPDLVIGCSPGFTPPPVTYTLTMAVEPIGGGTTNPAIGAHSGYSSGATATIIATTNTGYEFDKWTGSTVANPNSANTTILMNGNKSVTANFEKIANYNVYYDGNGNDSGTAPVDTNNPYNVGDTVTVLGEGDLAKIGYTFIGWNTASGGSGDDYVENDTLFPMPDDDVTLYAQWECNPCDISGWSATDVEVALWYAGYHGNSDPQIEASGTIIYPDSDCLPDPIEIDLQCNIYNHEGGKLKASYSGLAILVGDDFSRFFDTDDASYNSATWYELSVKLHGCPDSAYILIDSDDIIVVPAP